jgi:mono/diheme cytochrome c family protein
MSKVFFRSCTFYISTGMCIMLLAGLWLCLACPKSQATPPWVLDGRYTHWGFFGREDLAGPNAMSGTWFNFPDGTRGGLCGRRHCAHGHDGEDSDVGGYWMWMRSPEQERVVVSALFNRYCIRCHDIDGRGKWDIPGVPDFTNSRWQASRSDDQIARIIIEGRGAVMPAFRGTLTLEEAFAMARYLRTFDPSQQISRPDFGKAEKNGASKQKDKK